LSDLESFEMELAGCGDWRDAFRVALEGLSNNVFTRSLYEIDKTNLPTLELRNPDAYATIKDRRTREALVVSRLFQVARRPGAIEDLEICWDTWPPHTDRFLCAVAALAEPTGSTTPPETEKRRHPYSDNEAVKVFLRALDAVIGAIDGGDWKRFDILHEIAHGRKRRYGTPLDEIRICHGTAGLSLAEALRFLRSKVNTQ